VSTVSAAAAWWIYPFVHSSDFITGIFGYSLTPIGLLFLVSLVAIALDVAAGFRRRLNLFLAIVAAIIVISPIALEIYSEVFPYSLS
jgi:hypothetical protein